MVFLYVHGGYKEMWDKPHLQDPSLPRNMSLHARVDRQGLDQGAPAAKIAPPRPTSSPAATRCAAGPPADRA
jgi:hypothetical protein